MPLWLLLVCMVFAVYRLTRLAVKDDFPPVLWVRDRIAGGWRPLTPGEQVSVQENPRSSTGRSVYGSAVMEIDGKTNRYVRRQSWSPQWLSDLLSCTWCASGWVSGAVTAAVDVSVGIPAPWLVGFAVWGAAALLASIY